MNQQKTQYLTAFLIFFGMAVFGWHHSTLGIDLTDEGFYLSTSLRYALGDVPFQDEFQNAIRPFDLLMSPIFILFPEISLLQMRIIGLTVQMTGLLFLFFLLSRYGSPVLAALACSLDFFLNSGILTPSYNLLSQAFSLLSVSFYLFACTSGQVRRRILLSVTGGFFLGLCVLSYSSQVIGIIIPAGIGMLCFFHRGCRPLFLLPSLAFICGFAFIIALFILLISLNGLLPPLFQGITMMQSITPLGSSPWWKLGSLLHEIVKVLPYGISIVGIWFLLFVIISSSRRWIKNDSLLLLSIFPVAFFIPYVIPSPIHDIIISTTMVIGVLALFPWEKPLLPDNTYPPEWPWIKACLILWGFSMAVIYGVSSGNSLYQCRKAIALLLGAGLVSAHILIRSYPFPDGKQLFRKGIWLKTPYAAILPFIVFAAINSYNSIYRDLPPDQLECEFHHPKLKGVHSTCSKVDAMEDLLFYLKSRIDRGNYFLAYNYIPMLYYLTHTRPAYGAAWARGDWPLTVRQHLTEEMIRKGRIPTYCVRMLSFPAGRWNTPMPYGRNSPLDRFVESGYYLEHIIFPFEIWRYGKGPKLRLFEEKHTDFQDDFDDWPVDTAIDADEISRFKPLILQGMNGLFHFMKRPDGKGIRVFPVRRGKDDNMMIRFGYALQVNGFDLDITAGKQVIFVLKAVLSDRPSKPSAITIQDHTDHWEMNSVPLDTAGTKGYIVAKKIRNRADQISISILWQPAREEEWIEIKDVRIFVTERRTPHESGEPSQHPLSGDQGSQKNRELADQEP